MQKQNSRYCYTPSDLVEFFASPFASWMSRFSLDSPDHVQPDPEAPQLVTLAKQGQQHEQTVLAQLQAEGREVYTVPPLGDRTALTLTAMRAGHEVIYQGALAHSTFTGVADFLIRVHGTPALGTYHYEVWDTKLARVAQPEFLLQLCCYADLLETPHGRRPGERRPVLGDERPTPLRDDG